MTDIPKSCASCPSFLKAEQTVTKFKKSVGAPMCGRYGKVLGRPGMTPQQANKVQTHIGSNCDSHGKPALPVPLTEMQGGLKFEVTMPDLDARQIADDVVRRDSCKTCGTCTKFIRDDTVAAELGWTTGLCSAKGRLILPNRQTYEARGCEYREFGAVRTTTTGIHLLPEYEDAFQNVDPVKAYFTSKPALIEPHEYPSDKPATEDDRASGIRAWRLVKDPAGSGNEVYLPCYDPEFFDVEARSKIPRTNDDEHPELYVDHFGGVYLAAVTWTELDETPALWGSAGIGKTELFRHLAWLMCLPFERISITRSTELDDLAGKTHFSPEEGTVFKYGRLPAAWSKPGVICLDEPNVGPPDVWQFIRPLTDNSKQLVLDMNEGETVKRHNDCYFGLAMNPAWDPKNVGAEPIGDADASRLFHVYIELPPPELEREIIKARVKLDGWELSANQLDMLMQVAEEVRGLCDAGTLPTTWMIRPQIKVARALRWFEPITAYRRAVGDFLEPEAQATLLDVVRANVS
jgi:hypothetical protein